MHSSNGQKITSALASEYAVEQRKKVLGLMKATDGRKSKVIPKTKPEPKAKKEVLAEKDDETCVGAAITPESWKKSFSCSKEGTAEKLPLAYCSSYVIWLTKLDNKLSEDEVVISEYVFGNVEDVDERRQPDFVMAALKPGEEVEMNMINIWSCILNDLDRKGISPLQADCSCHVFKKIIDFLPVIPQKHFFLLCFNLRDDKRFIIDNMMTKTTFKAAYGDFSETFSKVFSRYLEGVEHLKHDIIKKLKLQSRVRALVREIDIERDQASEGARHKGRSEKGAAANNGSTRKPEKET
ncbi:LOW QUALITY PROTEIN: hypothetical protein Cgig2_000957 [Carnegiea gigantea]|uniref:Ubiquitin-like protease family profile domain-containing protein n=1 Tax=Carnegiea gigantea TaxID=171969 RepID=A0A9Q1KM34_9CARY|nr:LOW QUALITY PROTEIN: hypothetical protein Cgig2_000957 [Carnegiea gigantea]